MLITVIRFADEIQEQLSPAPVEERFIELNRQAFQPVHQARRMGAQETFRHIHHWISTLPNQRTSASGSRA
jgi:hypothetical protein